MTIYKVNYEGFAYVIADNTEQAMELFENDAFAYRKNKSIKAEIVTEEIDLETLIAND